MAGIQVLRPISKSERDACSQPLVGLRLSDVKKLDYTWYFKFEDVSVVITESPWRLSAAEEVYTSSADEEQQFGLPAPVNAAKRVLSKIGRRHVVAASVSPKSRDLVIEFKDGSFLEFFQLSAGYVAWRIVLRDVEYTCEGGGRISRCAPLWPQGVF